MSHWNGKAVFGDGSAIQVACAKREDIGNVLFQQAKIGRPCVLVLDRKEWAPSGSDSWKTVRTDAFGIGPRGGVKLLASKNGGASGHEALDFDVAVGDSLDALVAPRLAAIPASAATGGIHNAEQLSFGFLGPAAALPAKSADRGAGR
ncbi:hypothetical protein [Magnetospirillum sp. ME-1]|uniref:hypothetical protein n=1 Tax=Magnetospirillum sp. ME-1 TaxID=1639348 RepID=UPI0011AE9DDC|nr:hypothetical protein [Magnetospirillum sp. ME-1]